MQEIDFFHHLTLLTFFSFISFHFHSSFSAIFLTRRFSCHGVVDDSDFYQKKTFFVGRFEKNEKTSAILDATFLLPDFFGKKQSAKKRDVQPNDFV